MTGAERGGVDVGRIMEEVRSRVAANKAAGLYSEEEIAEIAGVELRLRQAEGFGAETDRLVSWLHAHWEANGPVDREGAVVAGPLREAAKRLLRALLSPLARLLLAKQNQINARIVTLLSGTLPTMRDSLRDLEERADSIAVSMVKEQDQLREELRGISLRLERVERQAAEGRRRDE